MPSGGTITVTAQRVEPDGPIELTVSDTGQGIPPELFDRILDPFITTKEAGKGTGLGLSIVHGIVEQHDGVLRFESTVGEGTAFTVRLPRIEAPLDLIQPPPRQPSTHALRVLVVEDNPDIRALERRALERRGHTVEEASSGADGLERLTRRDAAIDLVLLDVTLSGMSGEELFRPLRASGSTTPVLFTTAHDDGTLAGLEEVDERLHILQKPFELDTLKRAVADALASAPHRSTGRAAAARRS
jgi:CheY-like chemotaxis protein